MKTALIDLVIVAAYIAFFSAMQAGLMGRGEGVYFHGALLFAAFAAAMAVFAAGRRRS